MKLRYACPCVLAAACAAQPASTSPPDAPSDETSIVAVRLTTTSSLSRPVPAPALSTQAPPQTSLWVGISKIELANKAGVWTRLSAEPTRFDALAFGGGTMLWLADAEVPAGIYRDLRITFDSATLVVGATAQPIDMAAGVSMIALDNAFGGGGAYDVVLGFDVASSVWPDSNGYAMAPQVEVAAIVPE